MYFLNNKPLITKESETERERKESPLCAVASGNSSAHLVVQLCQSSVAVLRRLVCHMRLGGDGTRHRRDWHATSFEAFW